MSPAVRVWSFCTAMLVLAPMCASADPEVKTTPPVVAPAAVATPVPASKPVGATPEAAKAEPPKPGTAAKDASAAKDAGAAKESKAGASTAKRVGIDLSSDKPLGINAAQVDYFDEKDGSTRVEFRRNVRVKQENLELTCQALDMFTPKDETRPRRIVASGDVKVVQGDLELRCVRATFKDECVTICESSERVTSQCEGARWPAQPARFRRGGDWVESRELEFNLCTGKFSGRCGVSLGLTPKGRETEEGATAPAPASAAATAAPTSPPPAAAPVAPSPGLGTGSAKP